MKPFLILTMVLSFVVVLFAEDIPPMQAMSIKGFFEREQANIGVLSELTLYERAIKAYGGMPYYAKSLFNPIVRGYNISLSPYNPEVLMNVYYMVKEVKFDKTTLVYTYDLINKGNRSLTVLRWDSSLNLPNEEKFLLRPNSTVTIAYKPTQPRQKIVKEMRFLEKYGTKTLVPIMKEEEARVLIYDSSGWAMFDPMPVRPEYTKGFYTGEDK